MIDIINIVVSIALLGIAALGFISTLSVNSKYGDMFKTMEGSYIDKDIFRIEKAYKKEPKRNKKESTWLFVEKNYYSIKIFKIPLYILEELAINAMYYVVLIGLTFTFIEIALMTNSRNLNLEGVFVCSIVGLVLGMFLLAIRTICGLSDKKEIFTIYMCHYLNIEIDIEKEISENEMLTKNKKVEKTQEDIDVFLQPDIKTYQPNRNWINSIPNDSKIQETKPELMNERFLEEVIEQIMS